MLVTSADLRTYMDITLSNRQLDAADIVLAGLQSELESYLNRPIEVGTFTNETHVFPETHVSIPLGSFFYNQSLDSTSAQGIITYSEPPITIYLRNSPVVAVQSVTIKSVSELTKTLGEAMKRQATISAATVAGSNVVYTASSHGFTLGQTVSISSMANSQLNLSLKTISSLNANTFTVVQSGLTAGTFTQTGIADAHGFDYTVRRYGIDVYRGFANDEVKITYTAGLVGENIGMFKLMILRAATREMQNMHDDVVGVKDLNPRNVAIAETGFTDKELIMLKRYRRRRIA